MNINQISYFFWSQISYSHDEEQGSYKRFQNFGVVSTKKLVQTSLLFYDHTDLAYGFIFSFWRNVDHILQSVLLSSSEKQ